MLKTMYDIYIDINAQISKKLSAIASSLQELMDVYFVINTDTDRIFPDARREAVR